MTTGSAGPYAARLSVDYPDRDLDKFSTLLRLFYLIPIAVVLVAIEGGADNNGYGFVVGAGGILFAPTLLMILFREKYPRWWFDFNLQLARFSTRVVAYMGLMSDQYPSTDEEQYVHLGPAANLICRFMWGGWCSSSRRASRVG